MYCIMGSPKEMSVVPDEESDQEGCDKVRCMDQISSATNTDTAVMKTLDEFGVSKLEVGRNENKQTRYFFSLRCVVQYIILGLIHR